MAQRGGSCWPRQPTWHRILPAIPVLSAARSFRGVACRITFADTTGLSRSVPSAKATNNGSLPRGGTGGRKDTGSVCVMERGKSPNQRAGSIPDFFAASVQDVSRLATFGLRIFSSRTSPSILCADPAADRPRTCAETITRSLLGSQNPRLLSSFFSCISMPRTRRSFLVCRESRTVLDVKLLLFVLQEVQEVASTGRSFLWRIRTVFSSASVSFHPARTFGDAIQRELCEQTFVKWQNTCYTCNNIV
jgi:hypothetical protein